MYRVGTQVYRASATIYIINNIFYTYMVFFYLFWPFLIFFDLFWQADALNKPYFLAKYSSNQNEPKNKDIDNKIIDIFAVNELSPESSDEDLEDENWKKPE